MNDHSREAWTELGWARVRGQDEPEPYTLRFVTPEELDEVHALHRLVVGSLHHPHAFRPDDRAYMERLIGGMARTFGVFGRCGIVAYGAVSFPDPDDPENLGRDLGFSSSELRRTAHYDGSAVHPAWRGNGLQPRLTHIRHRWASKLGRDHILGTVSPFNPFSLRNFLAVGCRVRGLRPRYGGMLRFTIHRDLREIDPPPISAGSVREVPLSAIEAHEAMLRQGFEGFELSEAAGIPTLRWGTRDTAALRAAAS